MRKGTFAVPRSLIGAGGLEKYGYRSRKALVKVGPYDVDAWLFSPSGPAGSEDLPGAAAHLGYREDQGTALTCLWNEKKVPFLTVAEGKAEIHPIKDDDDAEKPGYGPAYLAYHSALQRLSRISGGISFHYHCDLGDTVAPFPDEPGVIHLFAKAVPPGEIRNHYIAVVFGHSISSDGLALLSCEPTRGRGVVLEDGRQPLVQVLGSNWYILIPTVSNFMETTSPKVFEGMLALAWNHRRAALAKPAKTQPPATRSEFVAAAGRWVSDIDRLLKKEVADAEKKIQDAQRMLAELFRFKREWETMIAAYRQDGAMQEALTRLPRDFMKLRSEPDIADIRIVDNGIHVGTAPIVIEHGGATYPVGAFTVRINARGLVTVWSEAPTHPDRVPHPHISKDGVACFGNATEALAKVASRHRYYDAVMLVVRWLKLGYTPALAAHKIEEWPAETASAAKEAAHG